MNTSDYHRPDCLENIQYRRIWYEPFQPGALRWMCRLGVGDSEQTRCRDVMYVPYFSLSQWKIQLRQIVYILNM